MSCCVAAIARIANLVARSAAEKRFHRLGGEFRYFAVFTRNDNNNLTLVPGTVCQMKYGTTTLYWYFLPLPVNVPFNNYEIREVMLSGDNIQMDNEGVVTGYDTVTPIANGGSTTLSGTQKGETSPASYTYTVNYEKGTVSEGSNVRVDTTTNSRPGIELRKTQWDGTTPLAGAQFTLAESEKDGGTVIGTFTSDSDGLITVAFLGKGKDYVLTETKAPRTPETYYHGIESPLTISVNDEGVVSVTSSASESHYELEQGVTPVLTIKNRPFTFQAVKKDAATGNAMAGVKFALHKQHTVDQSVDFDADPMPGYESLVTDANGVIPKIDNTLEPGTYQLRELQTLSGYELLTPHTVFTISETGAVTLGEHPSGVTLDDAPAQGGSIPYVMTVKNAQRKVVSVWKTDSGHETITTDATFALYKSADFDVAAGAPKSGAVAVTMGTTGASGLLPLGALAVDTYYLVETAAPTGYDASRSPIVISVMAASVSAQQGGNSSEVAHGDQYAQYIVHGQDADVWQVRVWNSSGYELPSTGGPGTLPFALAGGLAIVLALFILRRRADA